MLPVKVFFGPPLFGDEAYGTNQTTEGTATSPQRKEQIFIPSGPSGIRTYFLARDVLKYDPITISQNSD
jgi:hypothetical protein